MTYVPILTTIRLFTLHDPALDPGSFRGAKAEPSALLLLAARSTLANENLNRRREKEPHSRCIQKFYEAPVWND